MKNRGKKAITVVFWCAVLILLMLGAGVAILAYPGTPSSAGSLAFQGYIHLPKGKTLSVLDYISNSGNSLFVTNESNGSVYKIGLHSNELAHSADVSEFSGNGAAHGVVIDPDTHLAFVTRSETNTVDIFDPLRLKLVKQIPVADDPDGIFYDPFNRLVYVASGDSNLGTLIDPAQQVTIATISLRGKPEFAAFDPQTNLIYQNLQGPDALVALDLAKRTIVYRWEMPACNKPSAMAIDARNRRLFIACSGNAKLLAFDLDRQKITSSVTVGGGPDSIAFDSELHRLYVTGRAGILSVVHQRSPDVYELIDSIHTHYGAHTLALDPATHRVYLGYAALFVKPRLAVFSVRQ